jgi:5-formaminoimidazole-4-carboxamide-1-beta-D-ribofuranosyl 5'-monophosphate synthetase
MVNVDVSDETVDGIRHEIEQHRGKDDQISSRTLSEQFGINEPESFPRTREAIRHLVLDEKMPIAAGGNGYFFIETQEELNEYVGRLAGREDKIEQRRITVLRAAEESDHLSSDEDEWRDDDLL